MSKSKVIKIDEDAHTLAKAAVAVRKTTLQKTMSDAARHWFPLLDAARTATITGETEALAEVVKAIDDA